MPYKTDRQKAEDIIDIFAEYLESIGVFEEDDIPNYEKFGLETYNNLIEEIIEWI